MCLFNLMLIAGVMLCTVSPVLTLDLAAVDFWNNLRAKIIDEAHEIGQKIEQAVKSRLQDFGEKISENVGKRDISIFNTNSASLFGQERKKINKRSLDVYNIQNQLKETGTVKEMVEKRHHHFWHHLKHQAEHVAHQIGHAVEGTVVVGLVNHDLGVIGTISGKRSISDSEFLHKITQDLVDLAHSVGKEESEMNASMKKELDVLGQTFSAWLKNLLKMKSHNEKK